MNPSDLQETGPGDLQETGPGNAFMDWLRGQQKIGAAAQEKAYQTMPGGSILRGMNNATPSLPTALSMLVPGSGLAGAALRTGTAGISQGGEAALAGKDPLAQGLAGATGQAITEALPPVARPLARFASDALPGGSARAIRSGMNMVADKMGSSPGNAPPVPTENWGKFLPTGLPAKPPSTILGPTGNPMLPGKPAVSPQMVLHPELKGWTMGDVISPLPKPPVPNNPNYMGSVQALIRLLGAGGQEAITRGNQ